LIPPEITDGEVLVHAEVGRDAGRRRFERRAVSDRRAPADRREKRERRSKNAPTVVDKRNDAGRRSQVERRSKGERRAAWQATPAPQPPRRMGVAPQRRTPTPIA